MLNTAIARMFALEDTCGYAWRCRTICIRIPGIKSGLKSYLLFVSPITYRETYFSHNVQAG